jgi:NADH-quinone oxidoreductase subunit C
MTDEAGTTENGAESAAETEAPKAPPGMDLRHLIDEEFPGAVLEQSAYEDREDQVTFVLKGDHLLKVSEFLRDHPLASFKILTDLTAAHYPEKEDPFEMVYQLISVDRSQFVRLKVRAKDGQEVPSVVGIWSSANWMEREVFDLFGIEFSDHPDPRRIMLPDDWGSHPLRKDYPLEGRGERIYTKPTRKEIGE